MGSAKEQTTKSEQKTETGSHFRLEKSETLFLSKQAAAKSAEIHHNLPKSPTERNLDEKRVKELIDRIERRAWLPCNWATVQYNGIKYRMNGQHSSKAMIDAADHLPEKVGIHIDHYCADSPEGMAILFRQFDARFSGRSKQDVAGAYKGVISALDNVNRDKAKLGIEGIAWYERIIEHLPVPSGDDTYQLLFREQYHPFLMWLENIIGLKTPEMKRAPIIAAAYGTYLQSATAAHEFWSHVATADLSDDSDPRFVLSSELVRLKEERKGAKPMPPVEFYAKCVKAWNAFRADEKIRSLSVNTKKGLPAMAA